MKICIVPSSYPNEDGVGNTFVEQLVNEFVRMGNECVVITPINTFISKSDAAKYKEYEEKLIDGKYRIPVYRPRVHCRNIPLFPVSISRYMIQRAIENVIKQNNLEFDCFYSHFFSSALQVWHYAHKYNIPLFVATGESKIRSHFQAPCLGFSLKKFRQDTNGVICVSTKNLEECIGLKYADADKCKVFPNGANLREYKKLDKAECRKSLNIPENDFIISVVGEISERKGQTRIIAALDSLKNNNIKLMIIGKGDLLPERDYIIHNGKVSHSQLPVYLNASDVFVLPTLREGCCNAIVEAMACGLPIISSDRKFNHDILDSTNSIMVDPMDSDEIAKAINELFLDNKKRQSLSDGALTKATTLSISLRANNILKFITERI